MTPPKMTNEPQDQGLSDAPQDRSSKPKNTALLLVTGFIALVLLVGLGTWQVQRLHWKQDLIATVETRRFAPPMAAPNPQAWVAFSDEENQYRPVELKGRFDHTHERYLFFPLSEPQGALGGIGFMVFTPFQSSEGWWVLVNRGFVPEDQRDPTERLAGQLEGDVLLKGLIRAFEPKNSLTPSPDRANKILYARDRTDLLQGLETDQRAFAPYYIDALASETPPGGLPQGGETRISFSNNHLQYAITWYGLAIALLGVMVAFLRDRAIKTNNN